MRNYKNKVCFVQSEEIFQDDTRRDYLKINKSQLLTSNDEEEIFDFIKEHVSKNNVYNFLLHIDSGTLSKLLDYMVDKKQSSKRTCKWLRKCAFVCTYSNAGYVREKVLSLKVNNVYFALSPIKSVLSTLPDGSSSLISGSTTSKPKEIMVVVSNTDSPFFNEVYNSFIETNRTLVKTYVLAKSSVPGSGLTLDKLNAFADASGYNVILSLDTEAEYDAVGDVVNKSRFRKTIQIIECTQLLSKGLKEMQEVCDVSTLASGVSIQAMLDGLNRTVPYESCAASLTLTWKTWPLYVKGRVVNKPESTMM